MLNFLRKIKDKIQVKTPPLLGGVKNMIDLNLPYFNFVSFGELNKDKYFYLIKRSPGTGLFSNVTFVLNHLAICKKFDFIPVIDMKNFNTIYNEKNKVKHENSKTITPTRTTRQMRLRYKFQFLSEKLMHSLC